MTGKLVSLAVLLVLAAPSSAWATHASVGTGLAHAGPITTSSASTLPRGRFAVTLAAEYQRFDTFSEGELAEFVQRGEEDIHNVDSLLVTTLGLAFGVTDDLTLHLRIPHVTRNNISEGEGAGAEFLGDSGGVGDVGLLGHYRFLGEEDGGLQAALLLGLKLPTGKTSEQGTEGAFDAEFQPGSGSWDPSAGVAVTKPLGPVSLDASLLYTLVTEGTQDTELGDSLSYNAALSYKAFGGPASLDLIVEANGVCRHKEETGGAEDENSGGNIVFLSPGARVTFKGLMAYFSIGFPVVQDLNGLQNEVRYRAVGGISLGLR